jgi:hypothetical protein
MGLILIYPVSELPRVVRSIQVDLPHVATSARVARHARFGEAIALWLVIMGLFALWLIIQGVRGTGRDSRLRARLRGVRVSLWVFFGLLPLEGVLALFETHGRAIGQLEGPFLRAFCGLGLVGLVFPVSAAAHELGHTVGGLLTGMRLNSLGIGPVVLVREENRWTLRLSGASIGGSLGFTNFEPVPPRSPRGNRFVMMFGGPTANLFLAGCAWLIREEMASLSVVSSLASVGLYVNLWLFAANLIPFRLRSGFRSDGFRLLQLVRPPHPADALIEEIFWKLATSSPGQWGLSVDQVLEVARTAKPFQASVLKMFACLIAQETLPAQASGALLTQTLEDATLAPVIAFSLQVHRVLRIALLEDDARSARTLLERLDEPSAAAFYKRLPEAAVLLAERKPVEAAEAYGDWCRQGAATGLMANYRSGNEWAMALLEERLRQSAA